MGTSRPLAIVPSASMGIGYELTKTAAKNGYDPVIAADEQEINRTAEEFQAFGGKVEAVEADLAMQTGVNKLISAVRAYDKPVGDFLANAGRGLGKGFLDQNFKDAKRVVETKITGTIYLIQQIGRDMRAHGRGRILVTGSIAGFMPSTFQAVYNGAKAFLDSFSFALRHELRDSGGSVTCLMPGARETDFFEQAGMHGASKKQDPAEVAQIGFKAMQTGDGDVVAGWQNKLRAAIAHVLPADLLAEAHRAVAQPGSGQQ